MSRQFVDQLRDGQSVDEVFLLTEKQLRSNRNADLFLLAHLRDKTGAIHGLMWNVSEDSTAGFEAGDYVHVEGKVQLFQAALQIILTVIDHVEPTSVEQGDFEEDRSEETERHLARVDELLRGLEHPDLRELMACFLDDEPLVASLARAVAGIKIHHAFRGGLIEHIATMLEAADGLAALYPALNRDLLLCGVFLHDLGKVREIGVEGVLKYTDEGQLLGHIVLVLEDLQVKLNEFESRTGRACDEDLVLQLKHMVVSHHGSHESGSPRVPMTPEAVALHCLDDLDAQLNETLGMTGSDSGRQSRWTSYVVRLGRRFYKGRPSIDPDSPGASGSGED